MVSRRRRGQLPSLLSTWAALTSMASAINFTEISLPNILTDGYGRMGLVGDFDSISLYQFAEQGTQTYFRNGSHAIMTQLPNGDLTTVAVTNGHINDMCLFKLKNDQTAGLVVGGNFTRIGDLQTEGIALIDPVTGAPVPLAGGLSGTVNAILCDTSTESVFVGGDFKYMNSTNAVQWMGMGGWSQLSFQGFNGPVESISRLENGTIVFGGRFTAIGNETTLSSNPNGTEKITQQVVNLDSASTLITATLGSDREGFRDPTNVICSNGTEETPDSVFLFEDGAQGSWSADLSYTVYPTKLRLYNTHFENRGLKTFRFVSRPNNGIMNLTSVDPVSNERFYCDAWCPLSHDTNSTVPYQDFNFVNVIPTYAFRIEVIEWFGDGAGLNAIELFQDDIYGFADNALNEPSCKSVQGSLSSTVEGSWTSTGGPPSTDSKFLTGTFSAAEAEQASITFRPDIRISGRYQVLVYTPGCRQDNSCSQRGGVTVSGTFSSNETTTPEISYWQTNDFDKYDVFFTGYVEANSDDHIVEIKLRPTQGQFSDFQNVVASKVRFVLEEPAEKPQLQTRAVSASALDGPLSLNGVFSFKPGMSTEAAEQATAISIAGTQIPINSTISSVVVKKNAVFIAGDIRTEQFGNFLFIDDEGLKPVALGGLNGVVSDAYLSDDLIYLAGRFNDTVDASTAGLSHVAAYKVSTEEWQALGTGLDGAPTKIVPFSVNTTGIVETYFVFSGPFTKILASDTQPEVRVGGVAIWVSSKREWLERLSDAQFRLDGFLSQIAEYTPNPPFFAGSLLYSRNGLAGAASLLKPDNGPIQLVPLGIDISVPEVSSNSNRKRAIDSSLGTKISGVQAGTFYEKKNTTILGGRFRSGDVENLAFVRGQENNRVEGVPSNLLGGDNVITSLLLTSKASSEGKLYIGGSINTTIMDARVGGMAVFDLETNDFVKPQPPPLESPGNDSAVYTITQQPNGRQIYVGGSFTRVAPQFDCEGICIYDPESFQYFAAGSGFGGVVYASAWTDTNTLVVGGSLELNDTVVHLATYKLSTTTWTVFPNSQEIPGPVTTIFTPTGEESSIYIGGNANGRPFILRWDGTKWSNLGGGLQPGSVLRGIEVFELDGVHAPNDLLSQSQILMASGNIILDRTPINSSAALFDGINWTPFVLTTNEDGSSGSLGAFVSQSKHTFNENAGKLAPGLVVLISLALALALIFLIVVIGVIASYIRRRREGYVIAPTRVSPIPIPQDMTERVPPDQLFQGVGFASARGTPHI
ncbi:hypothetical protein TWF102_006007 [Orbilia oligospora]|uniref:Uncharacterized protein n=1 Tax=Orbilia oligospora TaxID=2813651 RepID=A0A7C8JKH5_ORBOL|nr:hypothetical protein TWF103_003131 [Orbilia oligospora]KAF3098442.1 hypothetical protein TWF102_006007 [Orbilia oligospora]KAF3115097.1 hypothetical protein TWF706_007216 [Orbilia oligospora]KAF3124646.1 hypothetical protein TWF703_011252 [Orbilia oligospora]KAF3150003.1 hypothetical protein TWF594_009909 [Orbilia oligospora]